MSLHPIPGPPASVHVPVQARSSSPFSSPSFPLSPSHSFFFSFCLPHCPLPAILVPVHHHRLTLQPPVLDAPSFPCPGFPYTFHVPRALPSLCFVAPIRSNAGGGIRRPSDHDQHVEAESIQLPSPQDQLVDLCRLPCSTPHFPAALGCARSLSRGPWWSCSGRIWKKPRGAV